MATLENWQQRFDAMVEPYESSIPYCYLDTRGLVTVGRGCQVSSAEAQTLPFYLNNVPASQGDILRDYNRLLALSQKFTPDQLQARKAAFYLTATSPTLRPDAIDALAAKRITDGTAALRRLIPAFDTWPDEAKIATLEMPWGLGFAKFAGLFPKCIEALRNQDWRAAAAECAWSDPKGIYKKRNANRLALYIQAAQVAEKKGSA